MSDVFEVLTEECDREIKTLEQALGNGAAADFSGYRDMCGQIRGLRIARKAIADLSRKYLEDNDD